MRSEKAALFGRELQHCYDCGSPVPAGGGLTCESCGGTHFVRGGTRPSRATPSDSYALPWPWDGLGAWPAGAVVALTGGPGSGKSTIAAVLRPSTWGTAEQTPKQVGPFFRRLGLPVPLVFPCTAPGSVRDALRETERGLFVLDSLTQVGAWHEQAQVLDAVTTWARSQPGRYALVILQINSRGDAAGLLELPHMVDAMCGVVKDEESGLRMVSASKNRNGPLFSRLFGLDARGLTHLDRLAEGASYSVEGGPGAYRLHPWPLPGARWAGLLDKRKPPTGYASAAILAPSYARGVLEPADVGERRAYAEAHGLTWLDPFELRGEIPEASPKSPAPKSKKPRKSKGGT